MTEKKKNVPAKKAAETKDVSSYDYGDHAGKGYENQTREDIAIPFLAVLQKGSPQLDTMVDAKAGMLFNTVTEELMDSMLMVPVLTTHTFVEWVPRAEGGGFVAVHQIDSEVVAKAKEASTEFGKYKMPDGHDLVESFYIYAVLCDDAQPLGYAVLAFSSKKIKVYKKANTKWSSFMLMNDEGTKIRPPMFSHLTKVSTVFTPYSKGDFHNFVLEPFSSDLRSSMLAPDDPRCKAGAELYDLIGSGQIRVAYETTASEGGVDPDDDVFA